MSKQEKLDCRVCAWPVITVVAIIAFACVAVFSDWRWSESPWTAAAAIATLIASTSALYISRREERFRSQHQRKIAAISAGKVIVILNNAQAALYRQMLVAGLRRFGRQDLDELTDFRDKDVVKQYRSAVGLLGESITDEQMMNLIVLPGGFSGRVSAAITDAQLLVEELSRMHAWFACMPFSRTDDVNRVRAYWSSIERIDSELRALVEIGQQFFEQETGRRILL